MSGLMWAVGLGYDLRVGVVLMICAILGRGRHAALAEEWKLAADAGVQLVELRVDCLRREPDLKRVLKERPSPMVFTVRRGVDGGLWRAPEEKRQRLMREAIVAEVDFVDIEMDVARDIRRFGKTRRIVSYHNLKQTPADLLEIAQQCEEMDADIVKIAVRAHSLAEAMRVLKVASQMETPTIAIAMGEIGSFTRVLGAKYGAPFTYANFNVDRSFAAGMLRFHDLSPRLLLRLRSTPETEVYAVIGDPIGHSLSPPVHNSAFRAVGQNKVMVPIMMPGEPAQGIARRRRLARTSRGYQHHHPAQAGRSCRSSTWPTARSTGRAPATRWSSSPTARRSATTPTIGPRWNRPRIGLRRARAAKGASSPLANKQVLILGAGGVARPIAFGLLRRRGGRDPLQPDNDDRAVKLAEELGCRTDLVGGCGRVPLIPDIVINCTPGRDAPERRRHARCRRPASGPGRSRWTWSTTPRTPCSSSSPASASAGLSAASTCSSARRRSSRNFTPGRSRRST